MTKRITALEKLETIGVSLVKRGANRKQFVEKSGDVMDEETLDVLKTVLADVPAENEAKSEDILKDDTEEKARGAVIGIARLMSAFKDVLKEEDVSKAAQLAGLEDLVKRYPAPAEPKKAEKGLDQVKEPEKKKKGAGSMTEEEFKKAYGALPEEMREKMLSLWKSSEESKARVEEAIQKAEQAEKEASELKAKALVKEFIAKADKDYKHIPGQKAEELGTLLKSLHDADPDVAKKVEDVLKAADKALEDSPLLQELGTTGSNVAAGSASVELDSLAKSLISKSEEGMTYDEAYVKVLEQQPHLYKRYLSENPSQTR